MCVLDNPDEFDLINGYTKHSTNLGIRIATEEEPNFLMYTSRLGMSYKHIIDLYRDKISKNSKFKLKLLHFFVNSGMKDTTYFWSAVTCHSF